MSAKSAELTPKQLRCMECLLIAPSILEAAKGCEVAERTIRRWLAEPAFQRAYRDARRQALEAAVARLQSISSDAVETLRQALTAPRAGDRIRAALGILTHSFGGTQLLDVVERVAALESQFGDMETRPQSSQEPTP